MKIKVKDLEPNPFRHIDKYPIDRVKVEALKTSIKEKSFWDNILVRPHGKKYQIAYGHHRHVALQELGIEVIDVPVREIDDSTMLQIMAEENLNWSTSPKVMTQTILAAKEFLDNELKKYAHLNRAEHMFSSLFSNEGNFQQSKQRGVGRSILVKYLGGNWTERRVETALQILKDTKLDQQAVCEIPTMEQADVFRRAVKIHETPKPTQKKIVKKIVNDGIGKRDIPAVVAEFSPPIPNLAKKKTKKHKPLPNVVEYVFKLESDTFDINRRLKALKPEMAELANHGRLLGRLIPALEQLNKTILEVKEDYERSKEESKKVAAV